MLADHDRIVYRGSYQFKPIVTDFIGHLRILSLKKDPYTFNFFWNQGLEEIVHIVDPAYGSLGITHFIINEYNVNRFLVKAVMSSIATARTL